MNLDGLDRKKEKRLRRFSLVLGLLLALLAHLLIFYGPQISYKPVLERAKVKRVMNVRPYQPPKPNIKKKSDKRLAAKRSQKSLVEQNRPKKEAPTASPIKKVDQSRRKAVETQAAKADRVEKGKTLDASAFEGDVLQDKPEINTDEWETLFAQLEMEKQSLEERRPEDKEWDDSDTLRQNTGGGGDDSGNTLMDSRVRVSVVSYPPTGIEFNPPSIPFPRLKVRKKELRKGICRVYYRVWINKFGKDVRTQLKTPSTEEDIELYAPFVKIVTEEVNEWPFSPTKSEVHVDVYFDLEEPE